MVTISLKVPEDLNRKIALAARKRGRNRSEVVREALEIHLAAAGAPSPGSCLDLAVDLVGCVEGPPDLSTRKKHFEGFGK